jgi:hypothetical protein
MPPWKQYLRLSRLAARTRLLRPSPNHRPSGAPTSLLGGKCRGTDHSENQFTALTFGNMAALIFDNVSVNAPAVIAVYFSPFEPNGRKEEQAT